MSAIAICPLFQWLTTAKVWSLETWIVRGKDLYRPAEDWGHVRQERDTKNSLIYSSWENQLCKVKHTLYGARSAVDEVM